MPNVLNREFTADAPNRKWTTDITYLSTAEGWVCLALALALALAMDLFSRKIIDWQLGDSLAQALILNAQRNAIESRRPDGEQLLHHSDRGCRCTSDAYQRTLGVKGSMAPFSLSLRHERTKHKQCDLLVPPC